MLIYDKIMLRKRSLVETVFDFMKNKFNRKRLVKVVLLFTIR